jgi:hypothetical protein
VKARHLIIRPVIAAVTVLGLISSARGSYLEQDLEAQPTPRPEPIVPPPRPRNEICDLVSGIHVGTPYSTRGLTIFPLMLSGPWGRIDYRTLDESLSRGYIEILEEKSPDVREVLVRNNSPHHVFLMAGEALGGGKQNRLVGEDVLLAPHGGVIRVPVYCIEKGRWSPGEERFKSGGFMAPQGMRRLAREKASQSALWDAVSGVLEESGTRSENEDFGAVYKNEEVAAEIAHYRREIRIPFRDTVGCVVAVKGRIVGSDIFGSPEVFRKLWPKLLDSYTLDAIAGREPSRGWLGAQPPEEEVRRFLHRVYRASFRERSARDIGRIVEIGGAGIEGEGLVFHREVVHVHMTPRPEVRF